MSNNPAPPNRTCPGCGAAALASAVTIPRQPVILNYRFASPEEAAEVPLRTIELRECGECGLVFNAAFEPDLVPYDAAYENRQSHSEAFAAHTAKVAKVIGALMDSPRPRIIEVGCGKGQFLRQLVESIGGEGVGFDTSYEGPPHDGNLAFHTEYLDASGVPGRFDAVVCRHVIEHVPQIGPFLKELAAIARACGEPFVFLETPRLEWILQQKSGWDFFYEHCNYFTESALASLCVQAGFRVLGQYPVFGCQYQLLVLKLSQPEAAKESAHGSIEAIQNIHEVSLPRLARLIETEGQGDFWVIWGAGAKGVCLANRLPAGKLRSLIDTNPAKQGFFVPGTRIPIVAPSRDSLAGISLVVIANPSYEGEIQAALQQFCYHGRILTLAESLI